MTKVQLVLSDLAVADILEQADWYITKSGKPLAKRWDKACNCYCPARLKKPGHWEDLLIQSSRTEKNS